jgi:hypothetical protein
MELASAGEVKNPIEAMGVHVFKLYIARTGLTMLFSFSTLV